MQTATPTEVTALKKEVDAVRQQLARREDLTLSKLQELQREGLNRTRELISQSVASQKRLRELDRRQEDNNLRLSMTAAKRRELENRAREKAREIEQAATFATNAQTLVDRSLIPKEIKWYYDRTMKAQKGDKAFKDLTGEELENAA